MKEIPLTQGQVAWVDDADFDYLNQWKWHAVWAPGTQSYYAQRATGRINGKQELIPMHRLLLGLEKGNKLFGDHIDHNTLDNRRSNLRAVTRHQNGCNMRRFADNRSGFKGVAKNYGQWIARITVNGKVRTVGRCSTPELAYAAYCKAALELHGEFARLV